jgi:hypothetical protein
VTFGLCRARDRVTVDQQLKYGGKCPRASGTAIEHKQFVRRSTAIVFTIENDVRLIGFGLRQTIFMKSYLALKERYFQNSFFEVSIR